MNIFSFPKLSVTGSDKIISGKVFKIGIIIIICFIASLFVRALVSDRINRANRAVDNLVGLSRFDYSPVGTVNYTSPNLNNEYRYSDEIQFFDTVSINVSNTSLKTLGSQDIVVFTGSVISKGKISITDGLAFNATDSRYLYTIKIPKGVKTETISLKVNEKKFTNFSLAQDKQSLYFKTKDAIEDSSVELEYEFTGVSDIGFETNTKKSYDVNLTPNYENIRVVNSANGSYQKDKTIDIKINRGDEKTGVLFFAGSDDITFVDRILKYAILFIILVFSFALYFDLRKGLVVNVIQYFLIGVSLALFYLLVLSLGEKVGYLLAYSIASILTVLMNGWYVTEVFSSKKTGLVFGFILLLLYIILYYLVYLTSINLLLGTTILYLILILFMIGSKNLNKTNIS